MQELTQMVNGLHQGVGYDADFGSLTTKKQKQTVIDQIQDALDKGAVIGAESPQVEGEMYHRAVVLENCSHDMAVMKHETFGPVLAVCKVKSLEEAVALANDSYLGLTASVWTKKRKLGRKMALQLEAGAITINDHLMSHGMAETPWGGYKMSSIGRSHGGPGLQEVVQSKVIIDDITHFFPRNIWWQPYSARVYTGMKAAANMLYGQTAGIRIKSLFQLVGFYVERIKR
jgi:acyl-CoA reductase-like NAD-dependent aldehyde dehydrogenase